MTAPGSTKSDKRSIILICILIFAVALGIRLPGIGWGLKNDLHNQSYHPDEPLIFDFVHRTHLFRGPQEREYYNYGTLFYAILRTTDTLGQTGGVKQPESLDYTKVRSLQEWDDINTYVSQFHLWGRYASAFFGALTAMLIFLVMRRWISTLGAISGAALIALAPAHVEHSRFQTVDIISLFFVALATLAAVRLLRTELTTNKQWWIEVLIASALVGCAASTRYSDGLMALSVMTAILVKRPKNWPLMLGVVPLVSIVAFCITTPGVITDSSYFFENFKFQANHANSGHGLVFVGRPTGFAYHIYLLIVGISAAATLMGIAGLFYAAIRKHTWAWVVLAYFIPYYLSIGTLQTMFLRYGFPLYVGVACGFAYAISAIGRRYNRSWLGAAVAALALIGIENPQAGLRGTMLFTKWMTGPDPRDEAGRYLIDKAKQTPNMDVGIVGTSPWFWTAAIVKDGDFLEFQPKDFQREYLLSQTHDPKVVSFSWRPSPPPMYATISSYQTEDAMRLKDRKDLPADKVDAVGAGNAIVEALNGIYQIDQTFGEGGPTIHDLEYIRPTIQVFKRKDLP